MSAVEQTDRRAIRAAAKRRRERRGFLIALISSIVVIGGLATLVVTSPGWGDVKETFFSWEAFKTSFPDVLRASGSTSSCS